MSFEVFMLHIELFKAQILPQNIYNIIQAYY